MHQRFHELLFEHSFLDSRGLWYYLLTGLVKWILCLPMEFDEFSVTYLRFDNMNRYLLAISTNLVSSEKIVKTHESV